MAKRRRTSRRKTYKLKRTAKRAARGKSVYKVKGGWRVSRARKRRRSTRRRKRKHRSNPGGWPCGE